jgi:photosystem II stability/assembly factor-like uncharacterized protein
MKKFSVFILTFLVFLQASSQDLKLSKSTSSGIAYNSICYAGVHTLYIVGDSGSLLKSVNGGESFFKLNSPGSGDFLSVSFHNPDTGYLCGYGNLILSTNDGGGQWANKSTYLFTEALSVFAMGQNTVYAVGYRTGCLPPGGTNPCGEILKSPDGGSSWNVEFSSTLNQLYSVYFPSADTGYVVGDYSMFCVYNGSGWSWQEFTPLTALASVHSPHSGIAYAVGYNGSLWKTSNSGITWNSIPTGLPLKSLRSVWFTSDSTGFIAGESGCIMKTTDGGANWALLNTGTTQWLLSITFSSPDTGFAVGTHKTILRTTDAGTTWNYVTVGTGNEKIIEERLRIIPTPAKDIITVVFPQAVSNGQVTVFSVSGTILLRQNVTGNKARMDITQLPEGFYLLQFVNSEKTFTGKIIKD